MTEKRAECDASFSIENHVDVDLFELEILYNQGCTYVLSDAIETCDLYDVTYPQWLSSALMSVLRNRKKVESSISKVGPKARPEVHAIRWWWVERVVSVQTNEKSSLMDLPYPIMKLFNDPCYELGKSKERAYHIVSEGLKHTPARATPEAVKRSCLDVVGKDLKQNLCDCGGCRRNLWRYLGSEVPEQRQELGYERVLPIDPLPNFSTLDFPPRVYADYIYKLEDRKRGEKLLGSFSEDYQKKVRSFLAR